MSDWCDEPAPAQLLEGIAQFNRGEFFEQHETLERLWLAERRPVRRLYQGILQVGVAFHHLRRLNYHGTMYMLTRGPGYLEPFAPRCQGVDVAALLRDAARAREAVESLGRERLAEFDWALVPKVQMVAGVQTDGLPGSHLIDAGLKDLSEGRETIAALLVSVGAPRLRSLGIDVPQSFANPEHRLYELLAQSDSDSAHSRYNALIRRLVSFERAFPCAH